MRSCSIDKEFSKKLFALQKRCAAVIVTSVGIQQNLPNTVDCRDFRGTHITYDERLEKEIGHLQSGIDMLSRNGYLSKKNIQDFYDSLEEGPF